MSNLPCEKKPSFRYPIGFWNYPSVQVTPVSQVESWKRAGITCNQTPFFSYGSHDPADMVAMLDEMHRAGMRAFVWLQVMPARFQLSTCETGVT